MRWILILKKRKMENNWTKVYSSNNPINAEIIKQMLEEHDIDGEMNQQDSSYNMFGNINIYVQEFSKVGYKIDRKTIINEILNLGFFWDSLCFCYVVQ